MAPRDRWHPPVFDGENRGLPGTYGVDDIRALQALATYAQLAVVAWDPGTMGPPPPPPSPVEVKRALDWIVERAAGTYDEPFEAGRPDVAAYLMGRRSVGLAIVKLMKLRPGMFDREE